jgi:hypothetical protein
MKYTTNYNLLPQYTESHCELLNHMSPVSTTIQDTLWDDILSDEQIPVNKHSSLNEETLDILRRLGDEEPKQSSQTKKIQHSQTLAPLYSNNKTECNNNKPKNSRTTRLTNIKRSVSPVPRSVPLQSHSLNKSMPMKDIFIILDKRKEKRKVELALINKKLAMTSKSINNVHTRESI